MTIRSARRALAYLLRDAQSWLPWQALRCVVGRDFARHQSDVAFAHDARERLNEHEAENDGLDGSIRHYPSFAGAAASLADGCLSGDLPREPQEPSVREDKQQGNSSSLSRPAGPQPDLGSDDELDYLPPQKVIG